VRKERPRHHFRVRIPNDLALVRGLRNLLSSLSRLEGFDEERTQEIALVATELINNAIENADASDTTEVHGGAYEDRLELHVTDSSSTILDEDCFELDGPPDPSSERGRGLFLVKAFTDSVKVCPAEGGGNRISVLWLKESEESDDDR